MLKKLMTYLVSGLLLSSFLPAYAQDNSEQSSDEIDEIIVEGIEGWGGHEGMNAFLTGDFVTAEIEFERDFISLKRADNARYNAASEAGVASDTAAFNSPTFNSNTQSSSGGTSAPTFSGSNNFNVAQTGSFSTQGKREKNILNDGILSHHDFALTKYMSGLSEIQLGKYEEAKKSLKTSLSFLGSNHDARMRLGLIYLSENNFDKAATQLEKIDKIRVKCRKRNCEDYDEIVESATTLASNITNKIKAQ